MKIKYIFLFEGNDIDRDEFIYAFANFLFDSFLEEENPRDLVFFMFLREIVKNIYDHADGMGRAEFSMKEGKIGFFIRDFGDAPYSLEEIKKIGSTKIGNDINFGNGIFGGMIEQMAIDLGIELNMKTSKGFSFHGVYKK